jgi:hypothetical protein
MFVVGWVADSFQRIVVSPPRAPRSPAATPAPLDWRSDRPLPTRLAVGAPPDSAPPRACSGLPATSENAPSITASAPDRTPGRSTPRCEPGFRADSEKQTSSRKEDPLGAAPGTTSPMSRCPCGRPPLPRLGLGTDVSNYRQLKSRSLAERTRCNLSI